MRTELSTACRSWGNTGTVYRECVPRSRWQRIATGIAPDPICTLYKSRRAGASSDRVGFQFAVRTLSSATRTEGCSLYQSKTEGCSVRYGIMPPSSTPACACSAGYCGTGTACHPAQGLPCPTPADGVVLVHAAQDWKHQTLRKTSRCANPPSKAEMRSVYKRYAESATPGAAYGTLIPGGPWVVQFHCTLYLPDQPCATYHPMNTRPSTSRLPV